ncbi:hypothetical protein AMK27_11820 [Streptomyces sp. CB02009]|nr:hypothetical protein AMK27_11820 [Streptomyces sp. CB02009]
MAGTAADGGDLAAASGFVLTSLVLLGALAVAVAGTVLEALSGSASGAASDGSAIETVLRAAAVLALVGGAPLLRLVRAPRQTTHRDAVDRPGPRSGSTRGQGHGHVGRPQHRPSTAAHPRDYQLGSRPGTLAGSGSSRG